MEAEVLDRRDGAFEIMTNKQSMTEIFLNVLGYQEDGEWVALALEMDLRGYGSTFGEALGELRDLVMMQISFALFKGQPDMIWRSADAVWFELFAEARRERLRHLAVLPDEGETAFVVSGIPIPPPHVIASLRSDFEQANA